ncbi:hypothetical protein S479_23690 [Salmonella enterica subsp. enterica serovar Newport]|nr:hypothetical protein [Salmonella enterica]EEK2703112.1 hypothetical protein [Salmonella enterica subsp. enterica serovar Newport]
MNKTNLTLPFSDLEKINSIIKLNRYSKKINLTTGSIFNSNFFSSPSVVLLYSGNVDIYHRNQKDYILSITPPFPIWFTNSIEFSNNYYLYCKENTEIIYLKRNEFFLEVENKNLWMSTLNLFDFFVDEINEKKQKNTRNLNNCEIIKNCLNEMISIPDNERMNLSIYDYILQRHCISKSSITKILKKLNDNGHIITKRAKLLKISNIPD